MTDNYPDIPAEENLPGLLELAKKGSVFAARQWLKGAVYHHCRRRRGLGLMPPKFTEGEAYQAAVHASENAVLEFRTV